VQKPARKGDCDIIARQKAMARKSDRGDRARAFGIGNSPDADSGMYDPRITVSEGNRTVR
jgi:hypothetical protein